MKLEIFNKQDCLNNEEAEVFVFPASFSQKRLWFLDQLEPNTAFYNLPFAVRLQGNLDVVVLEQSFHELIQRHEALRTSLITVNGEPVQAIAPIVNLNIPVVDLQDLPEQEREIQAQKLATEEARQSFVLSECPLLRVKILRLSKQEHILLLTMHHTISDGWSIGILLKEIAALYQAFSSGQPSPLPDLPLQYADYSVWQQEWLQGEVLETQLAYWKQQLDGVTTLQLPTDRPRKLLQSFEGATHTWKIPQDLAEKLTAFSQQAGVTLFMTLLTGFKTLLYRYTGQDDIVVGSAIANRNWAESEGIIGMFVNTLALRTQIKDNPSFQELLDSVRDMTLAAYAHQDLPFEKLVEELQVKRDLSRNPLFQVWFGLNNQPMPTLQLGDLTLTPIAVETGTTQFDLSLDISIEEQGLSGTIQYSTELFAPATIARIVEHFHTLLYGIVTNPQAKLSELPLLTTAQQYQLLVEWNNTQVDWPQKHICIHQLFEQQVEKTPEAVAVVFENQQLTYRELNQRANQLAQYLQQLEVQPDTLVGICMERSLEMVIGLLGILKAGGAYVPLEPSYPQQRLAYILADTQVGILLTQQHLVSRLPNTAARIICLDTDWETIQASQSQENIISKLTAENLAYVIYTSGSTGQPKGVMNTHQGLCNRLLWMQDELQLTTKDKVLQKTPFSFDVSVWEFFWPLITGARLVVAIPGGHQDSAYLVRLIVAEGITTLHFVPSMLQVFLTEPNLSQCSSIKRVVCSGEALTAQLQAQFFACVKAKLYNLYGPTEAAIDVSCWQCESNSQQYLVPIGRPIANMQLYILDQQLQPVPIGVAGELHIGGIGLARGYLNRPELTAQKFIYNPFVNYQSTLNTQQSPKIYKTGDLARFLPDGNIEYLGRIDHQVKIRGFRVELGEVEAAISCHQAVQEVVALVREDEPGNKRLVAYIVPAEKSSLSVSELRQMLKQELPTQMIPSAFVVIDALPLTSNGKIDRRALPKPENIRPELEANFVAPQNPVQAILVKIWSEVLGVKEIGINDNFFELGGDSILSIQVIARANQQGLQFTPKQIFQYQTIAELAAVIVTNQTVQAEQELVIGSSPLTPIQNWFFEQNFAQSHHYNQANLLICQQDIKPELLHQVVQHLLLHHDALRSRFIKSDSGWQQINANPDSEVPFTQIDLSTLSTEEQQSQITAIAEQLQASLSLSTGPLVRVALFNLGRNQPARLLFIIHHLVVDGVSWRILLEDFQTAYNQLSQGQSVHLPPKTTSFKYWANRLLEYGKSAALQQEFDYWLTQSQKKASSLPVDYPAGVNTVESANIVSTALSVEETEALLREVPTAYRTQINEILLTALGEAITNWTGKTSLLVDLEGHGREALFADVDLSRTVGWFTSIFPVALDLEKSNNTLETLKLVKEQLRSIPNQGIGYGLLRYCSTEEIALQLRTAPQAEICFNYLGQFNAGMAESGTLATANEATGSVQSPVAMRSYLIQTDCFITNKQFQIDWNYSKAVHNQSTIENLAQEFLKTLRSLITRSEYSDSNSFISSDFSAARIDQKDLNKLLAKINQFKQI